MTTTTLSTRNELQLTDIAAAGGRILLAAIFIISGINKIAAPAGTIGYIQSAGLPFPELILIGTIAVEVIGGAALAIGLRTRIAAGMLAAFSLAAAFAFHASLGDQGQFIHFFKNVAIAGGLLQVSAFGPGRLGFGDGRRAAS